MPGELVCLFQGNYNLAPYHGINPKADIDQVPEGTSFISALHLYRDPFALADTQAVIGDVWPAVRHQVRAITCLWGDSARDFCNHAVDTQFQWGEDANSLTVYRPYVPIIGGPDWPIQNNLDDAKWQTTHRNLLQSLGVAKVTRDEVSKLLNRLDGWQAKL